jgi:hypothetical protein
MDPLIEHIVIKLRKEISHVRKLIDGQENYLQRSTLLMEHRRELLDVYEQLDIVVKKNEKIKKENLTVAIILKQYIAKFDCAIESEECEDE